MQQQREGDCETYKQNKYMHLFDYGTSTATNTQPGKVCSKILVFSIPYSIYLDISISRIDKKAHKSGWGEGVPRNLHRLGWHYVQGKKETHKRAAADIFTNHN